jgi:hypothetical protein
MVAIKNLNVKTASTARRDHLLIKLSLARVLNNRATKKVVFWVKEATTKLIVTWTS